MRVERQGLRERFGVEDRRALSAVPVVARRQTTKEVAESLGGVLDTVAVLRQFLKRAETVVFS